MKELSVEEKARYYDRALAKAKEEAIDGYLDAVAINDIFPELKESEGDEIRERVIATIHLYYGEPLEDEAKEMIAWVENTQYAIDHAKREGFQLGYKAGIEKQGEQRPLYSQEVMDIAIAKDFEQDELKHVFDIKTSEESLSIDSDAHNNIVDECIYNEQKTSWSEEDKKMLEYAINMIEWYSVVDKSKSKRVSDWLKFLKDRVQPQQQQEWSEEDKKMWAEVSDMLWVGYKQSDSNLFWDDIKSWVKPKIESPKPQSQWKPSDEYKEAIQLVYDEKLIPFKDGNQWCFLLGYNIQEGVCGFGDSILEAAFEFYKDYTTTRKCIGELSRPQSYFSLWKPSDEQMKALDDVISSRDIKYDVLSELWKDLNKLK